MIVSPCGGERNSTFQASQAALRQLVDLAHCIRHFHRGFGVVTCLTDPGYGLFGVFCCQHSEYHRFARVFTSPCNPLRRCVSDVVVVIGIAADYRSDGDNRVDVATVGQSTGYKWLLEGTRCAQYYYIVICNTQGGQPVERNFEHLIRDVAVEPGRHPADAQARAVQLPVNRPGSH